MDDEKRGKPKAAPVVDRKWSDDRYAAKPKAQAQQHGRLEDVFVNKQPAKAHKPVHTPVAQEAPFWEKPAKRPASGKKKNSKAKPKPKPKAKPPAPKPPPQANHLVRDAPGDQTIAKNASLMNFLGNVLDEHDAQMEKLDGV